MYATRYFRKVEEQPAKVCGGVTLRHGGEKTGGNMAGVRKLMPVVLCVVSHCLSMAHAYGLGGPVYVTDKPAAGGFALVQHGTAVPMLVSASDWPGVVRAVGDLSEDEERVTGVRPAVIQEAAGLHGRNVVLNVVLIGTIGKSVLIDELVRRHKLDVSGVAGKWESAVTTIVENPMPGVRRALVIAGSDKRGTIFGAYDLSEQIGVSPWYWWADVATLPHSRIYAAAAQCVHGPPAVKYRGIFLNDEAPSLT